MLLYTEPFPGQNLCGVSALAANGRQLSYRLTWGTRGCYRGVQSLHLSGIREFLPQVTTKRQGFSCISAKVMDNLEDSIIDEDNLSELRVSPAYEAAMEALSSLISKKKRGAASMINVKYQKLDRMQLYMKILGLEEHMADLKIIHVAGTKGKGSTCAFCESILRECGLRTGLFISPHLIDVRERFRLNGLDITEEKFLQYFWDCWNQLKENLAEDLPMPPLFQFLTVLAFKIFVHEKVDVAIIEVGIGGGKDSTNVIKNPIVCGVASLGFDHMDVLGETLGEIASHKAGIFKPNVPAYTVPQLHEAMDALHKRAKELTVPLEVVKPLDCTKFNEIKLSLSGDHQYTNAALAVSLCKSWLQSTGKWDYLFKQSPGGDLPDPFLRGLSTARLLGRAQIYHDSSSKTSKSTVNEKPSGDLIFYLDGAHSPESMEACGKWFSAAVKDVKPPSLGAVTGRENGYAYIGTKEHHHKISKQILLFNCMDVRDPHILLPRLVNTCRASDTHLAKAIFVPSISTYSKVTSGASIIPEDLPTKDLSWQFNLQKIWERNIHGKDFPEKSVHREIPERFPSQSFLNEDLTHCKPADGNFACSVVVSSLPWTIKWLRHCVKQDPSLRLQVLVTGSLHLVGDVLKLLKR